MSEQVSSGKAGVWSVAAAMVLVAAGTLAYWNSFDGVFLWDDSESIRDNYHIRRLWPLSEAMSLPLVATGATVSGRPVLSLSLSLNHAVLGPEPWGYHLVNLVIHISGGLLLLGIVRRTARRFGDCSPDAATAIGLAIALLWLLHPLATAGVTYIVQRAESLTGCLMLLTLYAAIRAFEKPSENATPVRWYALSAAACILGMGVKQSMFAAPLLVLCYDAVFVSGGFKAAWAARPRFYVALAFSWALLGVLTAWWQMADPNPEIGGRAIWPYALTQPGVILYYLRLAAWPDALAADYSWPIAKGVVAVVIPTVVIVALLAATAWGLARRHWLGFVGAWFFLILAPSSSFAPLEQRMQGQRMYLPLAAVATLVVGGGWYLLRRAPGGKRLGAIVGGILVVAAAAGLTWGTIHRNEDYHDPVTFWRDNAQKRPDSFVAHTNLGEALRKRGDLSGAIDSLTRAAELSGPKPEVLTPLAIALAEGGHYQQAIVHLKQALATDPNHAATHNALGMIRVKQGRFAEALKHHRAALAARPYYVEAMNNLGVTLVDMGRPQDAIAHYQKALRLNGDYLSARMNLGLALLRLKQAPEAVSHYRLAVAAAPDNRDARYGLATALTARGLWDEARKEFQAATDDQARSHVAMGLALFDLRQIPQAVAEVQRAVELEPTLATAHGTLAVMLDASGRRDEAIEHFRTAIAMEPDNAETHYNLGVTLGRMGNLEAAAAEFALAAHLKPDYVDAHDNLAKIALAGKRPGVAGQHLKGLADALASQGRFADAATAARKAAELARVGGNAQLASEMAARADLLGRAARE